MKNFRMTLSRKLTFFIMGLLLIIWLTFGGVLVFTTAQNILTDSYTEAHSISQRYRYDSFTNAYTPPKDDWWVQHAHQTGFTGIIHPATNQPGSPYTEYTFIQDEGQVTASTAVGIWLQNYDLLATGGVTLLLDGLSAQDLFQLSKQLEPFQGSQPPPLSATGTQNGALFQVDTLTLGGQTYQAAQPTGGTDAISLPAEWNPLEEPDAYVLYPQALDSLQDWELVTDVARRARIEEGLTNRSDPSLGQYFWNYAVYDTEIWPHMDGKTQPFGLTVVLISTPLSTALKAHAPFLLLTLALVPLLGLLFSSLLRRMVVLPLKKTQQDFDRVAKLDFRGCEGDIERQDEIGDLNRNIRQMAAELQKRWDDERALEVRRQEFMAAASHELKTPLALLSGYTEAVAQDIGDKDRYLSAMEGEIDRMNGLVMELLDQTRLERMEELDKTERVDLTALAARLLDQMAPLFTGLDLQVRLEPGVFLPGDGPLLERAMGNLLSNTGKYCTPGGRVEVSLTNSIGGPEFRVENEAPPIPETELPRLFEPFYRSDKARDRSGSGMGLAIAQKIFTLHHLECWAENTQAGVRFTVSPPP